VGINQRRYDFTPMKPDHAQSLVEKFVTSDEVQPWVSIHATAYAYGEAVLIQAPGVLPATPSDSLVACSPCYQSTKLTTHKARLAWKKANPQASTVQAPYLQLASLGELVHSIIPQERRAQLIGYNFNFSKKLPKSVRRTNELMRTLTMILDFIFALSVPDEDKPQALELLLQTRWATKLLKVEAGKDIETLTTTSSLVTSYKVRPSSLPVCVCIFYYEYTSGSQQNGFTHLKCLYIVSVCLACLYASQHPASFRARV
jgi:hypothetical protein